jgi:hypothetical protein
VTGLPMFGASMIEWHRAENMMQCTPACPLRREQA